MTTNNWHSLPLSQLRLLLDELLKYLKTEQNIPAKKIEHQLQLSSLSKLRYEREFSKQISPADLCGIINQIATHYQIAIEFNAITNTPPFRFISLATPQINNSAGFIYLYYYYSNLNHQIMKARWEVSPDFKQAQLSFYDPEKKEIVHQAPYAQITQANNNLFAQTANPQASLLILHTASYTPQQLNYLAGTYNCVRMRDGAPVSGKVFLQKMSSNEAFLQHIGQDTPLSVKQYLQSHQSIVPSKVFFSINELVL